MTRHIALALALAGVLVGAARSPATAAYEFYVRIQGPKAVKPVTAAGNLKSHAPAIEFAQNVIALRDAATGQASGKRQYGQITISLEAGVLPGAAMVANPSPTATLATGAALAPGSVRELVTVGCAAFDVQADYGSGPVRGVLASQSVNGLCIFGVTMPSQSANAIVRIGLPTMPPGWSFNSQPQSKCVRSGETLDGTLDASPKIFSFQWGATHAVALPPGPCGKQ